MKAAYPFDLDHEQCTNECYSRTYEVVFVTVDGSDQSFWMQSTDLDRDVADRILGSITVD